jgi:hypothetical protein
MKLVAAGIALVLLGSAGAEAGIFSIFSRKSSLPKPIDHPIVRPKVKEEHKLGKRAGQHPSQYSRSTYGAEWGKILDVKRPHPIPEYLRQTE